MKKNSRTLTTLATLFATLLGVNNSFADGPVPPTDPTQAVVTQLQAINNNVQVVGNQMQSIAEASAKAAYSAVPNPSILQSSLLNSMLVSTLAANNSSLLNLTTTDITNQLQPLSDNLLEISSGMENANQVSSRLLADSNLKLTLSTQLSASDTIYSNDPTVIALGSMYASELPSWGINRPTTLHDNYFSFSSLLQPLAYTDSGAAASAFLTFITRSYNNPSTPIDYTAFQSKMGQAQNATDKMSLYLQLLQDNNYINYQLSARSSLASRSVAVNNFQNLITERTPVTGLGTTVGLVDNNGNPIPNASPLQIEAYLATRRANTPAWYTQVQTESPASVQRETLVVLAEIEAQNFQAHLDSERLLATLSAQLAASGNAAAQLNAAQAAQVNTDIQAFTLPSQTTNTTNISSPTNNKQS